MATYQDKLERIIAQLTNGTGLINIVPGSLAGQLSQAVAYEQYHLEDKIETDSMKNSLLLATGQDLDTIGNSFFGVSRLPEVRTSITSSMKILKFYVATGTFGDINNNNDIVVPQGTVLEGSLGMTIVRFRLSEDVTLVATTSEQYIGAELIQGPNDALPSGTIKKHYFTGYAKALNNSLLVTNTTVVATGRPEEDDNNYRYRITNSLSAFTKTNTDGIMESVVNTTGVAYAFIDPSSNGGGTFTVYVQGMSPVTSDELIDDVKFAIAGNVGPWVSYNVSKMNYIGLQLGITITTNNPSYYVSNDAFTNNIKDIISSYVNNFFGDIFDLNTIVAKIKNLNQDIVDVGIDTAYQYVGIESSREKDEIDLSDLSLRYIPIGSTEKIIIEPIANAITLQVQ